VNAMLLALAFVAASGGASELERLTEQRFDANAANDRAFYERLLTPNFLLLHPHGAPALGKAAFLDAEFPAGRRARPKSRLSGIEARVQGDTGVVTYEAAEPYPIGGDQRFEARSRRLDTYARIDGAWRLLSMAVAEVASWPDVAAVDPRVYAEYAGTYELSAETRIVVSVEGGRLLAAVTGQPAVELFPESPTTFFDRTDSPLARTVFERDASGAVVAQVYRAMGQTLRARKVS
jgi:hypothetical protein